MGENPSEEQPLKRDIPLGEALKEVMNLAEKYKFTFKDSNLLGERLMALGEAITLLTDVGIYEEFVKRITEKLKLINLVMIEKLGDDI